MKTQIIEETETQIVVIADGVMITRKKQPPRDFVDLEADSIVSIVRRNKEIVDEIPSR